MGRRKACDVVRVVGVGSSRWMNDAALCDALVALLDPAAELAAEAS